MIPETPTQLQPEEPEERSAEDVSATVAEIEASPAENAVDLREAAPASAEQGSPQLRSNEESLTPVAVSSEEDTVASKEAAADASEAVALPATPTALPATPPLQLVASGMSRELVVLRGEAAGGVASYERVAGRMLRKAWSRTSVFFTSAGEDEGSTEAAVNLATLVGRTAESTLLVEMDFTHPKLWRMLGQPPLTAGFEQALRGEAGFEECVQPIAGEQLQVLLLQQPMSMEEVDHLSGKLNDFLEWAEERFAWLVIDCPPVMTPSWTRWLELNADPVVLVARREKTLKHVLRKAAKHLGDRLSATVLAETAFTENSADTVFARVGPRPRDVREGLRKGQMSASPSGARRGAGLVSPPSS